MAAGATVEQYPRPANYSIQGVHWTPTQYNSEFDQSRIMDIVQRMGIKWVLLMDDGGGSTLQPNPHYGSRSPAEMLLDRGIMPVIRFMEPASHRFNARNEEALERLSVLYARKRCKGIYFFWQNECEMVREWEPKPVPRDWLEIVWRNFVRGAIQAQDLNARLVAEKKIPEDFRICTGTPALTSWILQDKDKARVNPFRDYMSDEERREVFIDGFGWTNIHNYPLNHPIDYPDDKVNKKGKPLTHEEYVSKLSEVDEAYRQRTGRRWVWEDWEDSEFHINLLRRNHVQPNDSLDTHDVCFRMYEGMEQLLQRGDDRVDLRDYVPLGSSEIGPAVDDKVEGRYPRMTPLGQIEMWDAMVARASRVKNYLFMCLWLIGVKELGVQTADSYEGQGLFTHRHDEPFRLNGVMPLVQHLIDRAAGGAAGGGSTGPAAGGAFEAALLALASSTPIAAGPISYDPAAGLDAYAQAHRLGAPLTNESGGGDSPGDCEWEGQRYRWKRYVRV